MREIIYIKSGRIEKVLHVYICFLYYFLHLIIVILYLLFQRAAKYFKQFVLEVNLYAVVKGYAHPMMAASDEDVLDQASMDKLKQQDEVSLLTVYNFGHITLKVNHLLYITQI